jgi:hypothetical protein
MKKTILSIAIVGIFAACNSNPKISDQTTSSTQIATADTAGTAEFNQWKENQAMIESQGVEELTEDAKAETVKEVAPTVIYREVPAKTTRVAKTPVRRSQPIARTSTSSKPVYKGNRTSTSRDENNTNTGGSGTGTGVGTGTGSEPTVVTQPAEEPVAKKEGWSKAAKGTAIGAGSGAVLGAIISKNKGKGAVIGGIVGAAGGYVLGRKQDKKDGRY